MVRSAAEQTYTEQALPGYTLDKATGLYHNQQTGYYYDSVSYQVFRFSL